MVGGTAGVLIDTVCQGNQAPGKHENSAIEVSESPDTPDDSAIRVPDFARGLMINMARRFVL